MFLGIVGAISFFYFSWSMNRFLNQEFRVIHLILYINNYLFFTVSIVRHQFLGKILYLIGEVIAKNLKHLQAYHPGGCPE
jgi:hypothetical protein